MCGLAGEVRFDGRRADVAALERMTACQRHRGPDGDGLWVRGPVGLGHRRLSIIDLSERGAQPMTDSHLGLTVVFNGIVYNHRQLRAELERAGHRFFSTSDTEVVLKAYAQWGTACVEHFLGMFAFAVVEHATGRVVLGRDRLGIKPLYVDTRPDRLRFASTLPALLTAGGVDTTIDRTALAHYMTFHSVVPAPLTILTGVRKLPPATVRVVEADGTSRDTVYWRPSFTRDPGRADWTSRGGGWSPTSRSACSSPAASTPAWWSRCSPSRGRPGWPRSASASSPPARSPATSSSTRAWSPSGSAPTTTASRSTTPGCCPASTPPSRR
jgi:asparagine synthase (glutamine-hydrolysing)